MTSVARPTARLLWLLWGTGLVFVAFQVVALVGAHRLFQSDNDRYLKAKALEDRIALLENERDSRSKELDEIGRNIKVEQQTLDPLRIEVKGLRAESDSLLDAVNAARQVRQDLGIAVAKEEIKKAGLLARLKQINTQTVDAGQRLLVIPNVQARHDHLQEEIKSSEDRKSALLKDEETARQTLAGLGNTQRAKSKEVAKIEADVVTATQNLGRLNTQIDRQQKLRINVAQLASEKQHLAADVENLRQKQSDAVRELELVDKEKQDVELKIRVTMQHFADIFSQKDAAISSMEESWKRTSADLNVAMVRLAHTWAENKILLAKNGDLKSECAIASRRLAGIQGTVRVLEDRANTLSRPVPSSAKEAEKHQPEAQDGRK